MFDLELHWKPRLEELRRLLRSTKRFDEAIALALELHAIPHFAQVSGYAGKTFGDEVWDGVSEEEFCIMPTPQDDTIAWHFWHITRIEDLVANLLLNDGEQVLDGWWLKKLRVTVTDTGNAMTDPEILDLSRRLVKSELRNYRIAVGQRTRKILQSLTPEDLRRRPEPESLDRLVPEGGLLRVKGSYWLREFWGGKTFAGLILLPLTRHHIMHLNECVRLKEAVRVGAGVPG